MKTALVICVCCVMTTCLAARAQPARPATAPTTTTATTAPATAPASPEFDNAGPRASGVNVTIESAKLDYLVLHRMLPKPDPEDLVSNQQLLVVRLKITNTTKKELGYITFNGLAGSRGEDRGSLALANRKLTSLVNFGALEPVGITRAATIQPGASITDLLAFAVPPEGVKPTTLYLPARNHGGNGMWKLAVTLEEEAPPTTPANPLDGK